MMQKLKMYSSNLLLLRKCIERRQQQPRNGCCMVVIGHNSELNFDQQKCVKIFTLEKFHTRGAHLQILHPKMYTRTCQLDQHIFQDCGRTDVAHSGAVPGICQPGAKMTKSGAISGAPYVFGLGPSKKSGANAPDAPPWDRPCAHCSCQ